MTRDHTPLAEEEKAELQELEKQPQPNRAARRMMASDKFRRKNGAAPLGDDPENPRAYREPRGKSMVNSLKRRRRDARIRAGTRESRGGADALYDEKSDKIIFQHTTKGERKVSRRRLELQAKMHRLLYPKLYGPATDDGARV
jgi:hypothetical protein